MEKKFEMAYEKLQNTGGLGLGLLGIMKNMDKQPTPEDLALEKRNSTYGGSESKTKRRVTMAGLSSKNLLPGSPDKISK